MRRILFLLTLFCCGVLFSQNLLWHFQTTSPIVESEHYLKLSDTDSQGNIYVAGSYGRFAFPSINSITFGNITNTTSATELNRAVIAKLDKNKNVIWVKEISSSYGSAITSLVIDKQDNIVVAGYTDGQNLKLDPNSNTIFDTGILSSSSFLVKLNPAGNFIFGNIYNYVANMTCTIDQNNNIISTGNYANYQPLFITDFNPDPAVNYNLPAPDGIFIMKNNADGSFGWARPLHAHNTPTINCVKVDHNNNIVISGNFEAYLKIDNITYPAGNTSSNRHFLAKFNNDGNFIWYQNLSLHSSISGSSNSKIDIDNDNNIYTASTYYEAQMIAFPNVTVNAPLGGRTIIYKISPNGNLVWNSLIKGEDAYDFLSIKLNLDNTINFFVRYMDKTIRVVNGNNNTEETVNKLDLGLNYSYLSRHADTYYLKFRNDGKLIFNKSDFSSFLYSQNIDYEGNIILTGYYDDYQDFDPDQDIKIIKYTNSNINGVVQKFGKCYNGTPDGDKVQTFCSSLNPTIQDLSPNTSYTTWYDSPISLYPLPQNTALQNNVTYYASVQDESCPYNPKRLAVNVIIKNSPPPLTVNDFYFCSNVNQMTLNQLNINNNQNIHFYDFAGYPISNYANIIAGNQYYVTQYNNTGCESVKVPFKVFSTQQTSPAAASQQTFCASNHPTLSNIQITGQNIKWYDAGGNILQANTTLINGQTYFASQTINSCESNKTAVQVTINETPKPTGNTAQDFCASSNPKLSNLVVAGTAIKFYDAAGNILPLTTPLVHGATYFVTQTLNNCESEKFGISVTLSTNNVPANDYSATACNSSTANSMVVDLTSYQSNIIANAGIYTFAYTDDLGNPIANPYNYTLNVGSTVIHVKVTTADGCFTVVRLSLTLNPKPVLELPEKIEFCKGKTVTLDAGSGFASYLWSTGATTQSITVSAAGNYSVTVSNNFGCQSTDQVQASYIVLPEITGVTVNNGSATVALSASGNFEYSLDNFTWQSSNIFTNLNIGEYIVYVRTKEGCFIGQKPFSIFNIPNAFTPNGDGYNDQWKIAGLENYPGTEVNVYDRRGLPVFKEVILKKPLEWDGKLNGSPISTGNYWYTIKVSDGRVYTGWLMVKNRE